MWTGTQARAIANSMMTGKVRLVLSASSLPLQPKQLVGCRVLPHGPEGARRGRQSRVLHDAMLRLIGFTLLHVDALEPLLERSDAPYIESLDPFIAEPAALLRAIEEWLGRDRRLIESSSGSPLLRAALVRVDGDGRVTEVVCVSGII